MLCSVFASINVNQIVSEMLKFALRLRGMAASTLHFRPAATEVVFTRYMLYYFMAQMNCFMAQKKE